MAQELQGLLDRIQEKGVKEANEEKDRIIAEARSEAEKIVAEATAAADRFRRQAEEDGAAMEARAKAAIGQAARDIVLALRENLKTRLARIVKNDVGEALTPDFMAKIILQIVQGSRSAAEADIQVMVPAGDLEKMSELARGSLAKELRVAPDISIGRELDAGLKVGFKGEDVFLDCSDEALTSIICAYIGPRLAAMLDDGNEQ